MIRLAVEEKIAFVKRTGLKLVDSEPGYVHCLMPAKGNENHIGSMYAGALFTLAEIPGGALWLSTFDISKTYPIIKSFNIEYHKPALGDITFTTRLSPDEVTRISNECMDKGKSEFTLKGELRNAEGVTVATSTGIYQLRKH